MANGQLQPELERKLSQGIGFDHLQVINESHMHSVPPGAETHFKIIGVAKAFDALRAVARHQAIYGLLKDELAGEVHALALHLYSPSEWALRQGAPTSPACLGGSK